MFRYARSGDVSIAYQVFGEGPDHVLIRLWMGDLGSMWDQPFLARYFTRMAEFSRAIIFDKRGTGMSDRARAVPTLEARMDDVRAVMDGAGSERAVLSGGGEGHEWKRSSPRTTRSAYRALRADVSVFAVSRFMGSSIAMIDYHYGHLARDSREHHVPLLDALAIEGAVDAGWTPTAANWLV